MKKWFMDRLEIFLTISICIVLVWMNIILFIPKIQKQENNVIENQIEYNDNSINRFDNTLSSRSVESRKIIIYKLTADKKVLYFRRRSCICWAWNVRGLSSVFTCEKQNCCMA